MLWILLLAVLIAGCKVAFREIRRRRNAGPSASTSFSPVDQHFSYEAGDILCIEDGEGFSFLQLLVVERIDVVPGQEVLMGTDKFVASAADHFLAVFVGISQEAFASEEEVREAVAHGSRTDICATWRPSLIAPIVVSKLSSAETSPEDLEAFAEWKSGFDAGEIGLW